MNTSDANEAMKILASLLTPLLLVGCGERFTTTYSDDAPGAAGGHQVDDTEMDLVGAGGGSGGDAEDGGVGDGQGASTASGGSSTGGGGSGGGTANPTGGATGDECMTVSPDETFSVLPGGCVVGDWDVYGCNIFDNYIVNDDTEAVHNGDDGTDVPGPFKMTFPFGVISVKCVEAAPECVWDATSDNWDCFTALGSTDYYCGVSDPVTLDTPKCLTVYGGAHESLLSGDAGCVITYEPSGEPLTGGTITEGATICFTGCTNDWANFNCY